MFRTEGYVFYKILAAINNIAQFSSNTNCLCHLNSDTLKLFAQNSHCRAVFRVPVAAKRSWENHRFIVPIQNAMQFFESEPKKDLGYAAIKIKRGQVVFLLKNGKSFQFDKKEDISHMMAIENHQIYNSTAVSSIDFLKKLERVLVVSEKETTGNVLLQKTDEAIRLVATDGKRLQRVTFDNIPMFQVDTTKTQYTFSVVAFQSLHKSLIALRIPKIYLSCVTTEKLAYFSIFHPSFHIVVYSSPETHFPVYEKIFDRGKYQGIVNRKNLLRIVKKLLDSGDSPIATITFDTDTRKLLLSDNAGNILREHFPCIQRHSPYTLKIDLKTFFDGLKNATQDIVTLEYSSPSEAIVIVSTGYEYLFTPVEET